MTIRNCIAKYSPCIKTLWNIVGIYLIWIVIHYLSAHLYAIYCTPYTIIGFITAPFLVPSPHCTGLRWCITQGASTIATMWIVIGTSVATRLGGYAIQ